MKIFKEILLLVYMLGALFLAVGALYRLIEGDWDGFIQYMIAYFVIRNAADLERVKLFLGVKE